LDNIFKNMDTQWSPIVAHRYLYTIALLYTFQDIAGQRSTMQLGLQLQWIRAKGCSKLVSAIWPQLQCSGAQWQRLPWSVCSEDPVKPNCSTDERRPSGIVIDIAIHCSTDVDSAGQRSTLPLGLRLQCNGAHGALMRRLPTRKIEGVVVVAAADVAAAVAAATLKHKPWLCMHYYYSHPNTTHTPSGGFPHEPSANI